MNKVEFCPKSCFITQAQNLLSDVLQSPMKSPFFITWFANTFEGIWCINTLFGCSITSVV